MNTKELKELWGEELFDAFADAINEDGWLTQDWGQIVEDNYHDLDEDYNDNEVKKNIYTRMYMLDTESKETESGIFIRPV